MSGLGVLALAASAAGRRPGRGAAAVLARAGARSPWRSPPCSSCRPWGASPTRRARTSPPGTPRSGRCRRSGWSRSSSRASSAIRRATCEGRLLRLEARGPRLPLRRVDLSGAAARRAGAVGADPLAHPAAGGLGARLPRRRLPRPRPAQPALRGAPPRRCRCWRVLRFPEKFAILAVLGLVFAGVLGWQRLLDERRGGAARRRPTSRWRWPGSCCATAAASSRSLLLWTPRAALWLIAAHGAPDLGAAAARPPPWPTCATESWAAVATAAAVAALLALCRWRAPLPARCWRSLAVALLAADLWHYGHGLIRTLPAAAYRCRRRSRRRSSPAEDRVFVQPPPAGRARDRAARLGRSADAASPAPTSPGWSPTRGCSGISPTPSTTIST